MDSMPNEILTHIFSNLESKIPSHDNWEKPHLPRDNSGPPNDLLSVSLVCRKFHDAARPLMYRTVSITSETVTRISPQTVVRTNRPRDYGKLMDAFLRTLFAEPRLGLNIRHLRIDSWETNMNIDGMVRELVESNKGISDGQKKLLSGWLTFPTLHLEDGVVLITLILSPKLQSVDLRTYTNDECFTEYLSGIRKIENSVFQPRDSDPFVDDMSELNINDPDPDSGNQAINTNDYALATSSESQEDDAKSMLADLKEIRRRYISTRACAAISKLQDVLYNPKLETLRLHGFMWTNSEINQKARSSEISCSLKRLQLESCLVDDKAMENILSRCKELRYLSITLPDLRRVGFMGLNPNVSLKEMGNVLRTYGRNLETFELDTYDYSYFYRTKRPIGSLHTLESLRHFKISAGDILKLRDATVEGDNTVDQEDDEDRDVFSAPLKDNLPLGLESLYIVRTSRKVEMRDSQLLEAVRDILRYKPFSALRKVEVEIYGWLIKDFSTPRWEAKSRVGRLYSDYYNWSESERSVPQEVTIMVFDRCEGATRHSSGN
ncbi:unnamed protein product [Clonostachys chloroleuca]|uniref:F-box domain-containing protein n=1 Tax=Clonostachys chloroleuca TaxID=1926264 RepID=A0AA35LPF9_9HYPO|nr:unnamed protein product [Clonostachys chloroleuca]